MARKRRKNKNVLNTPEVSEEPVSGAALAAILPKAHKHKSRFLFIFLALVLPGFGLNNFYAGYKKRAIMQIICTLSMVLIIVSFAIMFMDILTVDKDANGVPFE